VKSLDDPNLNFFQTYTLTKTVEGGSSELVLKDAVAAPSPVGPASIPAGGRWSGPFSRSCPQ